MRHWHANLERGLDDGASTRSRHAALTGPDQPSVQPVRSAPLRAEAAAANTGMTMGDDDTYTIEQLAQAAGMTTRNVRAYRTKGLLPPPARVGRVTTYGIVHLHRLWHIRRLRRAGLPLKLIMEAAQRGDDLSPRGPFSRLTTPFKDDGADDGAARAVLAPPGSPVAALVQQLSGHGVSEPVILVILLQSSRSGRALAAGLADLLCSDLLTARPQQLPRPLLDDTVELAIMLTQQALAESLL